eukprot:358989-Chlamydomonas_euryale.AAC.2
MRLPGRGPSLRCSDPRRQRKHDAVLRVHRQAVQAGPLNDNIRWQRQKPLLEHGARDDHRHVSELLQQQLPYAHKPARGRGGGAAASAHGASDGAERGVRRRVGRQRQLRGGGEEERLAGRHLP